jgi:hypothetical protein
MKRLIFLALLFFVSYASYSMPATGGGTPTNPNQNTITINYVPIITGYETSGSALCTHENPSFDLEIMHNQRTGVPFTTFSYTILWTRNETGQTYVTNKVLGVPSGCYTVKVTETATTNMPQPQQQPQTTVYFDEITICVGNSIVWVDKVNTQSTGSTLNKVAITSEIGTALSKNQIPENSYGFIQCSILKNRTYVTEYSKMEYYLYSPSNNEIVAGFIIESGIEIQGNQPNNTPGPQFQFRPIFFGEQITTENQTPLVLEFDSEDIITVERIIVSGTTTFNYYIQNKNIYTRSVTTTSNSMLVAKGIMSNDKLSIQDALMSHPCLIPEPPQVYAKVQRELTGAYYIAKNGTVLFEYDEEYNIDENNSDLNYKVYNVIDKVDQMTSTALTNKYGDNRFSLNVQNLESGTYILEVTNTKNEVFKLRFIKKD